jgi:hypothetical protein
MPGYHSNFDLTLNEVGVYRIRCLEFCGLRLGDGLHRVPLVGSVAVKDG